MLGGEIEDVIHFTLPDGPVTLNVLWCNVTVMEHQKHIHVRLELHQKAL